jgi:hypothetical protein
LEEAEGFEPSSPAKGCQFSRLVHSTALPRFHCQDIVSNIKTNGIPKL